MRVPDAEGAVAIVVALFLAFVGIGVISLTTDLGSLRQSKRALVTDTDAAALAGAIALAEDWMDTRICSPDVGEGQAAAVLFENNLTNQLVAADAFCEPPPTFAGSVHVQADQPSPGFFSGQNDLSAFGTTTATFALGVSPFEEGLAVCGDIFPRTGVDITPEFVLANGNLAVPYTKAVQTLVAQLGTACGIDWGGGSPAPTTPGGWGWLDGTCTPELGEPYYDWCNVDTGNDIKQLAAGMEARFPIFDAWNDKTGTKADLRIVGHASATVVAACRITGGGNEPKDPQDCNSPSRLSGNFNGQPEFIVLSDVEPFYYSDPTIGMFDEADYSICDVDLSERFCP